MPKIKPRITPEIRPKIQLVAASFIAVMMLVSGCSGGDDSKDSGDGDKRPAEGRRIETVAKTGRVVGNLPKAAQKRVLSDVTAVVDGWIDAAYVEGDYPRGDFEDAYPGFTKGAAALARTQSKQMSNAAIGEQIERVDVVKRTVTVDVLSPKKPAGATARVLLVIKLTGDVERTDRVSGRLMLTPGKSGWQVFGFEIARAKDGGTA